MGQSLGSRVWSFRVQSLGFGDSSSGWECRGLGGEQSVMRRGWGLGVTGKVLVGGTV